MSEVPVYMPEKAIERQRKRESERASERERERDRQPDRLRESVCEREIGSVRRGFDGKAGSCVRAGCQDEMLTSNAPTM